MEGEFGKGLALLGKGPDKKLRKQLRSVRVGDVKGVLCGRFGNSLREPVPVEYRGPGGHMPERRGYECFRRREREHVPLSQRRGRPCVTAAVSQTVLQPAGIRHIHKRRDEGTGIGRSLACRDEKQHIPVAVY